MRMVERKYGKARRVWIFDRGIVSEENLASIAQTPGAISGGHAPLAAEDSLNRSCWPRTGRRPANEVEVKLVPAPGGEETYLLCRSAARQEKEKAIRSRFSASMEKALTGLEKQVGSGKLKDRNKIERRLGAIRARHSRVADLYHTEIVETEGQLKLDWKIREDRRAWQQAREGAYLLRTNLAARLPRSTMEKLHPTDRSRSGFPRLEERAGDPSRSSINWSPVPKPTCWWPFWAMRFGSP